ncbi:MAG: amidohydrolase [Oscillospiraceae bacterium]|nr:MAG: amidohydrolase [Oscillospiraceae bacterium]
MDRLEQKILDLIDQNREEIIAAGRDIWTHAEMGFKEFRTAGKFADFLKAKGLEVEEGLAVTGVKGYLKGKGAPGTTVALIGEMDALPIPNHPDANPETGASHCCGHNAQVAGVIGSLFALTDPEIRDALDGNVVFFAVPAEEFVDIEFKKGLMEQGKIGYGGGKCELIRIGAMDDIDIAVGHHTDPAEELVLKNNSSNGFVNKVVEFHGRKAHAAGAPHRGLDALNAATLAMHAIDMQRESFRDCDTVRVHGFISRGGEAMNIIADNVTMEHSVRAKNIPAFTDASEKFDRSIRAGAVATGCGATINTMPGYLPTIPAKDTRVVEEALADVAQTKGYRISYHRADMHTTGSTDFGDVSCIMPLLQFGTGGYRGTLHNPDMLPIDEELAYVATAKIFALVAYKLLKNGADAAHALIESYEQVLSKEEYIRYMDSMKKVETIEPKPLPLLD